VCASGRREGRGLPPRFIDRSSAGVGSRLKDQGQTRSHREGACSPSGVEPPLGRPVPEVNPRLGQTALRARWPALAVKDAGIGGSKPSHAQQMG
jgi:hypothetical protein